MNEPLTRRREWLEDAIKKDSAYRVSGVVEDGPAFFEAVKQMGLEGIMAKQRNSTYLPGKRSDSWLKIKTRQTIECVIIGYTQRERRPRKRTSARCIWRKHNGDELKYVGKVGSGFDEDSLKAVAAEVQKLPTIKRPVKEKPLDDARSVWVEPKLMCEVEFASCDERRNVARTRISKTAAGSHIRDLNNGHNRGKVHAPNKPMNANIDVNIGVPMSAANGLMPNLSRRCVMRSIWKGHIRFSLVTIPIRIYNAVDTEETIRFNQLHKEDNGPVGYEKKCKKCGKALTAEEIVKGYQFEPEQYVIVSPEDLAKIKLKSTKVIEIEGFIDASEVHPSLYESPYFAGPDGPVAAKTYSLLTRGAEGERESGHRQSRSA